MGIDAAEGTGTLDDVATGVYAHLFHALGDPTRLAVLQHLASGDHRVRDLVDHLGFAQSTVSKHLAFLLECHLVTVRPDGRASWYSLSRPAPLADLIASAQVLLRATGTDAALCDHIHHPASPDEHSGGHA